MRIFLTSAILILLGGILTLSAQSLGFKGQAISWATVNPADPFQAQGGLRYIPELSLSIPAGALSLDGEFSANIWGTAAYQNPDSTFTDGDISPYRLWIMLSSEQFELRVGLQKINFGSAYMFRPLMWFDQIDPRDPLQLTDGVYGLLGRYYFLNNANIWLWGLYGNNERKGWELFPSKKNSVEYGGRLQIPMFTGEIGATYHHRNAFPDGSLPDSLHTGLSYPENRFAIDTKFDLLVGLWFEGTLIHQDLDFTPLQYKTMLNGGADYTFGMGNGLNIMAEVFAYMQGNKAFQGDEKTVFGGLSASYPINIFHNVNAILFYDFSNESLYRFINWSITYDRWRFYVMGFWNPESYQLYNFDYQTNLYSGWGFQLMAVFNH